jgi:hypothetical protein
MRGWTFKDIIETLGLFPFFNWDASRTQYLTLPGLEKMWMLARQTSVEKWRSTAYEWSKLHHRTPICHKWLCGPGVMVTEFDM